MCVRVHMCVWCAYMCLCVCVYVYVSVYVRVHVRKYLEGAACVWRGVMWGEGVPRTEYIRMENTFVLSYRHCNAIAFTAFGIMSIQTRPVVCGFLPRIHAFITSALIDSVIENAKVVNAARQASAFFRRTAKKNKRAISKIEQEFVPVFRIFFSFKNKFFDIFHCTFQRSLCIRILQQTNKTRE